MKKYIYLVSALIVLSSCVKEITLPYRSVQPLYVIEGRITDQAAEVIVTRTRDMEDGDPEKWVSDAVVTLSGGDGTAESLIYFADGYYRPDERLVGEPGRTYTLEVSVGGERFTSSSLMSGRARIDEMYFRWLSVMGERILFCTLSFEDIAGEENYYCYRMRRNGKNYRWNVLPDRGYDGDIITVDIFCMTEKEAKDNKEEDWDDILYEGDELEIELQTIDRRTYDYLYSVGLSERTSANPIDNFEGGCLGYFSAYSSDRISTIFSFERIRTY